MIKQASRTLLFTGIALVLLSACHKEKQQGCPDPSRIFVSYTWEYYEQTNVTSIAANFILDNQSGVNSGTCEPFTVTFNGDTFQRQISTYCFYRYGLIDSGTIVYTDVTGARYTTEVKPIQVPQIPDTFTSVNQHGGYYFYWEGDSTGQNESMYIAFCSSDSFTCYAPSAGSFSYGIELWDMALLLPAGTNNTEAALTLEREEVNIPAGAPKGAYLNQKVHGRSKIISVY